MIRHFDKNKNGKIEFTESELKSLLDEVYNQGKRDGQANNGFYWSSPYSSPYYIPYISCTPTGTPTNITTTTTTLNDCLNNQLKNED